MLSLVLQFKLFPCPLVILIKLPAHAISVVRLEDVKFQYILFIWLTLTRGDNFLKGTVVQLSPTNSRIALRLLALRGRAARTISC